MEEPKVWPGVPHPVGAGLRGRTRSNCSCRRRSSLMSRWPWRAPIGQNPASPRDGGRRRVVRPGHPAAIFQRGHRGRQHGADTPQEV